MIGWTSRHLSEIPTVTDGDPDDPDWHPLQHHFGLTAFGANVFAAREQGQTLVEEHDERASGQEELYLVLEGEVDFELNGDPVPARRGTVIAVPDPAVKRRAIARTPGATLLALGSRPGSFVTTWRATHFEDLPLAD